MATVVQDNIYLFEHQAAFTSRMDAEKKEGKSPFWDKQDFYRRAIEAAIQKYETEEKKIDNLQHKQK